MKIGIVIGRFPPDVIGGAELQVARLAEQLAGRNHDVTVFTRRYHQRDYLEMTDGYTIRRRNELPVPGLRMAWDTFPALWDISRHQPRLQVLLCYQTLNSGLIGLAAQSILGIPMVLSIRGNLEYRLRGSGPRRYLVPSIYKRARGIIVQSERIKTDMKEQLRQAGLSTLVKGLTHKCTVIPNGITLPPEKHDYGKKIVFVGRLIKNKGVADLIEAVRQLPGEELLVIGDGPEKKRLSEQARGLPVTFAGAVPPAAVFDYLKQARVLALPSHLGDGFPNVILEAMACGVPVVATATAGIPDLVYHGETGLLYDVGNVTQLIACLKQVLQDDDLWQRLSSRSVDAVKHYAWPAVVPRVERLLASVLKTSPINI